MKIRSINSSIYYIVLFVFCLFCLALYSSFGRPLWIDEFLHFALGAYQTTGESWQVIRHSILGINHGQTGIYMLINYWLMQIFGVNTFWLRFPSLFSGLVMMLATLYLFRLWGISFLWQFMGIIALSSQTQLMYFVGEARPYMPLVAATVCTLAYYSTSLKMRAKFIFKIFGIFSILIGVLFHPYFCVYWLSIILFTYLQKLIETEEKISTKSIFEHINIPLCLSGSGLFILVGLFTWLRGHPNIKMELDPFQWIKIDTLPSVFFESTHFEFLQKLLYPVICISIFSVLIIAYLPQLKKVYIKKLISPILLIFFALIVSVFISYISYRSNYWIMTRQWVASMALVPLGFVWLGYRLSEIFSKIHFLLVFIWMTIFFSPIILKFGEVVKLNIGLTMQDLSNIEYQKTCPILSSEQLSFLESVENFPLPNNVNNDEMNEYWVCLANNNIRKGGKVWKGFRGFYDTRIK